VEGFRRAEIAFMVDAGNARVYLWRSSCIVMVGKLPVRDAEGSREEGKVTMKVER